MCQLLSSPKTIRDRVRDINFNDFQINASQAYARAQSFNIRNFGGNRASSSANTIHLSPGILKADHGLSSSRSINLPRGKTISYSYSGNLKCEICFFIHLKQTVHLHMTVSSFSALRYKTQRRTKKTKSSSVRIARKKTNGLGHDSQAQLTLSYVVHHEVCVRNWFQARLGVFRTYFFLLLIYE